MATTISREQLYELVWTTPIARLAPRYGLSDVGMAKLCDRHKVPRPPRGYWARLAHGQAPNRTPLPRLKDAERSAIVLGDPKPQREPRVGLLARPRDEDVATLLDKIVAAGPVALPGCDERPHKFVRATEVALRRALKRSPRDRYGLHFPQADRGDPCLWVEVGPASVARVLRLCDALVKAAGAHGVKAEWIEKDGVGAVWLVALGEPIGFRIKEKTNQKPHLLTTEERAEKKRYGHSHFAPSWDYTPSGFLSLTVWHDEAGERSWRDGEKKKLEHMLAAVLAELPWFVQRARDRRAERWRVQKEQAEAAKRRWEEEQRRRDEQNRVDDLLRQADAWEKAERLRGYLAAVRAHWIATQGEIEAGSPADEWLAWGSGVAERIDPMRRG